MVEEQIDWRKTVEAILENANRPFVPISKSFIQQPRGSKERSSVLSQFVTNGDLRGLKAYLLIAASASSPDTENGGTHRCPCKHGLVPLDARKQPVALRPQRLPPRGFSCDFNNVA